jgi:single stranded DNA-binding protein
MSYLNSVTIVGFVGAGPEQRQARNNGSKRTVLSVVTQRSWKNADDEWASKTEWHHVRVFRPQLTEYVATTIKNGSHVLVEGSLVSTTCERGNGKGKKTKTNKQKPKFHDFADYVLGYRFAARIGRNRAIPLCTESVTLGMLSLWPPVPLYACFFKI